MLGNNRFRLVVSTVLVALTCVLFLAGLAAAADNTYVGVKKCKMCHKKPEQGEQFGIWEKSGHANAFATLATDEAKAEAAKLGIDDPQTAPECLKCHVPAFAVLDDLANQKITLEEGVSCESCHGAGSGYFKKKTMKGITAGEIDGATVGLMEITEEVCTVCHTAEGNSFYQEFDFEARVKDIAHPIPAAE